MKTLPRNDNGELSAFAWPGGYPIYYVTPGCATICPSCARDAEADPDEFLGYKPTSADVNWEDPALYCENCSERIESAYAEDEAE